MLINSVRLGIDSTFHSPGTAEVKSIWVMNPFKNLLAVFTPTGLGVTFFCIIMVCLITKKGYNWLSGYKFERDPRGFDIVAEGTHGTGGWWTKRAEIEKLIDIGPPETLEGVLIGKQGEETDEEYLAMKPNISLNRHVMIYGASGTGKSRGFVLPFIYGMATKKESCSSRFRSKAACGGATHLGGHPRRNRTRTTAAVGAGEDGTAPGRRLASAVCSYCCNYRRYAARQRQ